MPGLSRPAKSSNWAGLNEAEALYRKAMALRPTVAIRNNLACVLKDQARYSEAAALFRQVLAARPQYCGIWYNLVHCHFYDAPDHDDVRAIKSQLGDAACTPEQRMYLSFALGKIYDDCDCYDQAFNAFSAANVIKDNEIQFDPAVLQPIVDKYIQTFDQDFFSDDRVRGSSSSRPVFIVGMPRSGKTLVEKLLAFHPRIYAAGELPALDQARSTMASYPDEAAGLNGSGTAAMAAHYLGELHKRAPADADFVIDTMPGNYRHLGLIWQLFPNARIIHCVRDPLDTGLFTYFRCFRSHNITAYNLEHIGKFHLAYRQFMQHWQLTLPMPVHEVRYETLVASPLDTMHSVYRFLELQAPETGTSALSLYTRELGRWRCYARHLDPLLSILR